MHPIKAPPDSSTPHYHYGLSLISNFLSSLRSTVTSISYPNQKPQLLPDSGLDDLPHLPVETIELIFSKLPMKSIFRFKCLNKHWFEFLKNIGSTEVTTSLALVFKDYSDHLNTYIYSVFGYDCLDLQPHPLISFEFPVGLTLVVYCNGIMCLSNPMDDIVLVNPALKEANTIPKPRYLYNGNRIIGFGFDDTTMDFKVVTLSLMSNDNRAEVYSLRSNAWRCLDMLFPLEYIWPYQYISTYLNGVVYWCLRISRSECIILAFNMATELFQRIEFPQGYEGGLGALIVLNKESLGLFSNTPSNKYSSKPYVIWSMNRYENEVTWTKLYSLKPSLYDLCRPIAFLKEHIFIYEPLGNDENLVSYDVLNHSRSDVPVSIDGNEPSMIVGPFWPSSVSIRFSRNQ